MEQRKTCLDHRNDHVVESYTLYENLNVQWKSLFSFLKSEKWNHLVTIVNKTNRIIKIIVEGLYFLPWGKHFQQNDINSIQFLVCTTETCHHVYLQNLNHEILLPRSMNVERKEAKISKTRFQWEEHTKVKLDWKLWHCFSELYYCAIINLTSKNSPEHLVPCSMDLGMFISCHDLNFVHFYVPLVI